MSEDQLYLKNDLVDYADTEQAVAENTDDDSTYLLGNRDDWITAALPHATLLETVISGGYNGTWAFVAKVGGYWWVHAEGYGTCGHCDAFIDREQQWLDDTLRQAYCFDSVEDALAYLSATDAIEWKYGDGAVVKSQIAELLQKHRTDTQSANGDEGGKND